MLTDAEMAYKDILYNFVFVVTVWERDTLECDVYIEFWQ